ncbi:MAG: OmpW family outer membrane protein [Maricaulaceae bacterium]|jgi:outer membrane protein
MKSLRVWLAGAALAACLGGAASAGQGDIFIRGRLLGVLPDDSASIDPIGGDSDISDQWVPEIDATYFFTDHIAVEVIAAVTPHEVVATGTSLGTVDLGDVTLLPPTVTLQYHFDVNDRMKPYVGAGVNYTHFFNDDLPSGSPLVGISYDDSFGWALQAGVDIAVNETWFLNLDVKKIDINTDVTIDAGGLGIVNADVDIDPVVVGVGFGRKF